MSSAVIAALQVTLGLNAAQFNTGLANATQGARAAAASISAVGAKMAGIGAAMTLGITTPIVAFGVASSKAAIEAANALAQVEAALTSTGNKAGYTSKQLAGMAEGLMNSSLFDDDDIMENVTAGMIRFGNITGDVFARAQQVAVDYSARTGKDLSAATTLIGKALDNPAKAMGALSKAGITLSDSQQAAIKSMVKAGDTAGAQALVLQLLESRFRGAAQAAQDADPYDKLKDSVNTLSESFGGIINTQLVPLVEKLAQLANRFNDLSPAMQNTIAAGVGIAAALGPLMTVMGGVMSVGGTLVTTFLNLRNSFITATAGTTALSAAMTMLRGAMAAVGGPIGLAIAAVLTAIGVAVGFLIAKNLKAAEAERQLSERVREKADALRAAKEAAEVSRQQTGTLTSAEMEAAKQTAALTGQTALLEKAYYRAAAAAKYLALTQNAQRVVQADNDLRASEESAVRTEQRMAALAKGDGLGPGVALATGVIRRVRGDTVSSLVNNNRDVIAARKQVEDARLERDAAIEERRNLKTIRLEDPAWASPDGGGGGGTEKTGGGKGGPSAADLRREAEARSRALEDYNHELELQEAQLRGDEERVQVLERQGSVRQRTRTLIDQEILKDKDAAAAEAERVQVRLDAAREESRLRDQAADRNQWERRLWEIDARGDILAKMERQALLEERIKVARTAGFDLITATAKATSELAEWDRARADAAERVQRANELDMELQKARLRGDSRAEKALARQAELDSRALDYQTRSLNPLSPKDARAQAEADIAGLDQAELQGHYRDFVKDGFKAAMDGDLAGFAQSWIKDWAGKGLEESLNSLGDILMRLFSNIDWGKGPAGAMGGGINLGGIGKSLGSMFGKLPGFATGGSFRVGGAGAVDSKLVSMRLTPGEMVDIRRPGQLQAANNNAPIHFDLRGALMTADLMAQVQQMAAQSGGNALRTARAAVPADRAKSDQYRLSGRR